MGDQRGLVERAAAATGRFPLSDQLLADWDAGVGLTLDDDRAMAHASHRDGSWTMQVVVDPEAAAPLDARREVAERMRWAIAGAGGGTVDWWVFDATDDDDRLAGELGFSVDRDLWQMHRPLPAERHSTVETRAFVVGQDEAAWLAVNNRAFAGHAEQSDWTVEDLQRRFAMTWFDPAGFLLHERDGVLAAYCWTKMHGQVGEIYVIGVDPAFQGLGLGSELTLAGLESLHDRGAVEGMLYVDGDNRPAQTTYERLGFTVTRRDRAYRATIEPEELARR